MQQYTRQQLEEYASSLARVAALSNLFSESVTPFIHYRATEYLYARTLNASNLARSDIAIDAKRGKVGVGLKTFVYSGKPKYEKIAEFNKDLESFDSLSDIEKIARIAQLRNERIDFAGRVADVNEFIYHCIARLPGKLFVFETAMPHINTESLQITDVKGKNISFTDGQEKYRFNSSKSTLFKEFYGNDSLFEKPVVIHKDPFELLNTFNLSELPIQYHTVEKTDTATESVYLPLYGQSKGKPYVYPKSALNQWNAGGRQRNENEVYISIPAEVHAKSPDFFPPRDTPFELNFPNGDKMQVKVCQDNSKALMSQHNSDLGEWLLRDVLNLEPLELLTYAKLEEIGIGSVEISKIDGKYFIDFKQLGTYEAFIDN